MRWLAQTAMRSSGLAPTDVGKFWLLATVTNALTGTEYTTTTGIPTDVDPSTTYLYRVRAVQEEAESAWSAVASGTTKDGPPVTPTLVATTTGQSMIRLSWTAVDGATVYHLEFLEGVQNSADFENPNTNPTRRTISGNFNNYVHTGLKAGTQYSYRLRAVAARRRYGLDKRTETQTTK